MHSRGPARARLRARARAGAAPARNARIGESLPRGPGRRRGLRRGRGRAPGAERGRVDGDDQHRLARARQRGLHGFLEADGASAQAVRHRRARPPAGLRAGRLGGSPHLSRRHAGGGELRLREPPADHALGAGGVHADAGAHAAPARHENGLRRRPQHRQRGGARGERAPAASPRPPQGGHPGVPGPAGAGAGGHGTILVRPARHRDRDAGDVRQHMPRRRPRDEPDGCGQGCPWPFDRQGAGGAGRPGPRDRSRRSGRGDARGLQGREGCRGGRPPLRHLDARGPPEADRGDQGMKRSCAPARAAVTGCDRVSPMSWTLKKKAQARLAQEQGTIRKDWGGKVPVALVYPNTYAVGMSNLGFQTIYWYLNQLPDVVCERVFLPDPEDADELRRTSTPPFSLESLRSLSDFHMVAFSITYEGDYINALRLLALAGIPLRTADRGPHDPLVLIGGVCAFSNPDPLAPFMDFIVVAESQEVVSELLQASRDGYS